MKSVRSVRIVVVADSDHALMFAARLSRMQLGEVTPVAGLDQARRLCRAGGADVCIVANDEGVLDARPTVPSGAPGRGCGVPSLMVVAAASPALRKSARRAGYASVIPAAIAPRMLYRRLRAALQRRRVASAVRRRLPPAMVVTPFAQEWVAMSGKPTLH
jgi:DNA-binding response OmpR family regulator